MPGPPGRGNRRGTRDEFDEFVAVHRPSRHVVFPQIVLEDLLTAARPRCSSTR